MSDNCVTNICQYFPPKTSNKSKQKDLKKGFDLNGKEVLIKLFNKIDSQISKFRDHLYSPLMQSLFEFISNNSMTNKMRENSFETKFKASVGLIPTVLLSNGFNSSEHKFIYNQLIETIQDLTSFVVYLNSSQTQNSIFKTICDSILNEEIIESCGLDEKQLKRSTFASIFELYEEYVINKNTNNFCPPIVLFFDEIESFDHSLITTLILIIKEYIQTIPFIIIFSKCNETTSLQHLLPSSATDFLIIHHFSSVSKNPIIDSIINELLVECSLPFKLGPNVLDFIVKTFQKFDFSIQNINHIIKFALFLHFYTNELSFLCQSVSELKSYVKTFNSNELQILRNSGLFDSSLNNKEFKKSVFNEMSEFITIHNKFVVNLKILHKLLNQNNRDISLLYLYVNALNKSFDFKPLINSLNILSQNQWKTCLENCLSDSFLDEKILNNETQPLMDVLKSRQKELMEIIDTKSQPQVMLERMELSEVENKLSNVKNKLSNLKTRSQWKDTINPLNKPKVLTKFEIWKKTTLDLLEKTLNGITNPLSSPMRKVVFFDDLDSLKEHIFVIPRNDVQKSLNHCLVVSEKSEKFEEFNEKQLKTDFHKLFILYNESQSMINMFDWFMAFKALAEQPQPLAKSPKRSKTDINDESIVRFLNAVSDFEYIGLIQSAKRKTDHLMRLVWF